MTVATVDTPGWVAVLGPAAQIAERIADTEFVPAAMRGKPDVVTACIMYGDAIGVHPMQALQSIHVIDGRPAPSAELMRALVLRAGHSITVHEMSGSRCRVSGLRAGRPESERVVVEWNVDMARSAGLLGRQNWQRYPRAMLLARATSDLARMIFPDAVKGLGYIAEDEQSAADLDIWPVEDKQPAKQRAAAKVVGRKTTVAKAPLERAQTRSESTTDDRPPVAPPTSTASVTDDEIAQRLDELADDFERSVPLDRDFEPISKSDDDVTLPGMPDLEPEQPITEPTPRVAVGGGQLRGLHASLREVLGNAATSDDRHALLTAILHKPIVDTGKVTRSDAGKALIALERIKTGVDVMVMRPDGSIEIRAVDVDTGELDDDEIVEDDDGIFPAPPSEPQRRVRRDWDAP